MKVCVDCGKEKPEAEFNVYDSCFVCRAKSTQFGTVPGGYARTRVLKEHEMPKKPSEDSYGKAVATHNGVPLVRADNLEPVRKRDIQHAGSTVKNRLEAVKAAGTIKE